jgi:hypothetical protein
MMISQETVVAKPDWLSLQGKTLEGGYELGDVLDREDAVAHFRARVLGDSSIHAYASFYAVEGAAAQEQLQIWQDLKKLRHPNLKTPLSSGRLRLHGAETIYVVCSMPDETLSEILGDRGLTEEEGQELLKSLAGGLDQLQSHGFTHGCVSPEMAVAVGEFIQLSTECVRRINSVPKVEIAKPRYLAPEAGKANVTTAADIWCLGATIFESLVQRKYETAWFSDLERLGSGAILKRCLDVNPNTRCKLRELTNPGTTTDGSQVDAIQVPPTARAKPVQVTRKRLEPKRVRPLDPTNMELVKFDSTFATDRLRVRVKSGGAWRGITAGVAALILIIVVIWLVILPKFQTIPDSSAVDAQQKADAPANVWPTKTVAGSDSAADGRSAETRTVASTDPPPEETGNSWRFVLGSYDHEQDADRRIELLNKTHPDLDVKKLTKGDGGPYFVVAGDLMSHNDAVELRKKALRMGISRASYVGDFSH